MRRRPTARLGPATAVVAVLVLGGCGTSFGLADPASEQADTVASFWSPAVWAALAVGAFVWALITWSIIRYRRRSDALPTQVAEHIPIELTYTVIPIIIVVVLFAFGTLAQRDVSDRASDPDVTVLVEGFQWSWRFTYEDQDVIVTGDGEGTDGPELVLPVDQTTRLELVALDVNHSFWVPRFLSKRDLIPGVDNEIDVTPNVLGTHQGRCAEFCGLDHWRMYFKVRIVSEADFQAWVAENADTTIEEGGG
ncbi:cytochrome c oxidase subunit II [Iamia majanohamensis]|uniref:Cytochrome c oxidase subunit 2 n=1 Tax=Iamia majanohamensis TaxID=467976 RepID=A0AAF0BW41_9ACTN|nr:cytochrome c oxidase subunit II [Iamia majanohamensis]WCO67405.1 cytochrome c oxidase subunit II [Iamia majanohamensis]